MASENFRAIDGHEGVRRFYPPTPSDIPLSGFGPYEDVHHERVRAHLKHRDKPGGSMEQKHPMDPDWLPVLVEEVGEVAKVLCDYRHGLFDEDEMEKQLRSELVQVAAMTTAWLDALHLTICSPECTLPPRHEGAHLGWDGSRWTGDPAPADPEEDSDG